MTYGHKTCMCRSQEVWPVLPDSKVHTFPSAPGLGWGVGGVGGEPGIRLIICIHCALQMHVTTLILDLGQC